MGELGPAHLPHHRRRGPDVFGIVGYNLSLVRPRAASARSSSQLRSVLLLAIVLGRSLWFASAWQRYD